MKYIQAGHIAVPSQKLASFTHNYYNAVILGDLHVRHKDDIRDRITMYVHVVFNSHVSLHVQSRAISNYYCILNAVFSHLQVEGSTW